MKDFEYSNPTTVEEAVALLSESWGRTEVLAGGTDLITSMKQGITSPGRVVSLKNIKALKGISSGNGMLTINAATPLSAVAANSDVQQHFPALATAIQGIGSAQIANAGTVGGDLLQRPRCWYFRQGFGLLGSHDGQSLIPGGDNRYHAIFGNSGPAYFVNPSSLAPALIALGAYVSLVGTGGERRIKVVDLHSTPSSDGQREFNMKPNEILTAIAIPMNGLKNATCEIRPRRGLDWPMVVASVAYKAGSSVSDACVVLGHVAPVPWYSSAASAALNGKGVSEASAVTAGQAAARGATPLSKNGYKVQQVKVAVKRAILAANA
jgi:xanthine dehydrogenase YagS FAD-binding subunit